LRRNKEIGKKNILVLSVGTPTAIYEEQFMDAILLNLFSGERSAEAIMDILEGKINPSGKLPFTMPSFDN